MNAGRKPEIVCIGAQKAGTSWLHETLSTRPDIWVPPFKELHFFDHKFVEECRRWAPWHVKNGLKDARKRHVARNVTPNEEYLEYLTRLSAPPMLNGTWYKYVFSRARDDQKCLDVTPEYSCIPDVGVDFFKRFLPNTQLIFIIRDPLQRLKSQLRMNAQRRKVLPQSKGDWKELLDAPALHSRGNYLENIPRWDERYTSDQLLYIPFGRIKSDPLGTLHDIEVHCDLPPHTYTNPHQKVHQSGSLEIPEFVTEHLRKIAVAQNEFIQNRFGTEFLELTV